MYKITIQSGIGYDRDNHIIPGPIADSHKQLIIEAASHRFGGCTILPTAGGWKNDAGRIVIEPGIRIEILAPTFPGSAEKFAEFVRLTLNQSLVILTVESIDAKFIG